MEKMNGLSAFNHNSKICKYLTPIAVSILFFFVLGTVSGEPTSKSADFNRRDFLEKSVFADNEGSQQQKIKVTGKVTDSRGVSLPGVTVVVNGTANGTITDNDGQFTLSGIPAQSKLVVSFVGMKSQEIYASDKAPLNIVMMDETIGIEEVVAIGYGTSTRKAITGAISSVKPEVISKSTSQNVGAALQGRVAGVQVTQNSGNPEADVNIRIRGVSSVYAGSAPLLVVDGVVGGLELKEINPSDIASIEILKDASAGAIYGSRAANGVILVTTKTGSKENSAVSVDFTQGNNTITNWLPIANGPEYLSIMDKAWQNSQPDRAGQKFTQFPINGLDGFNRTMAEATNTDWKNYVTQPAGYTQLGMSVNGASEKTKFYLSGQYRNESGYDAGLHIKRAIVRFNIDHEITKWLSLGAKFNVNYTYRNNAYASYADYYGTLLPIYPVMSPSTSPSRAGRYFYDRNLSGGQGINPLYRGDQTWGDQQQMRTVGDVYLDIRPMKGMVFHTEWGLRFAQSRNRNYQSRDFMRKGDGIDPNQEGSISNSRYETYRYTGTNTLTYGKTINEHAFNIMVGNSLENFDNNGQSNTYEGFPTDYFTLTNANTSIVSTRQSISVDQYRFISFMGRARYDFKKRYFAEINYRADYSSRFGKDNRWGYFPGAGASWVISEENFMKDIHWINYAKFRLSCGNVGNGEVGNYPYLSQVVNWGTYGGQPGFLFNNIGNNSHHWEKQVRTNIALDYTVVENRISGSIEYFVKVVYDLIVNNKIGAYHGYYVTSIVENLGGMKNSGFDFNISSKNLIGKLKWTTDLNISKAKSIVTKLSPQQRWIQSGNNIVVEGQPLGAYYLPIYAGVDAVTGHELIYTVNPGMEATRQPLISDLSGAVMDLERTTSNGNHSVLLTDKTPYPKLYGGISNTFSYKGFELSGLWTFQYGNYIYDSGYQSLMYTTPDRNVSSDLLQGWTSSNPTNVPLIYSTRANIPSTRFLYDGSYVRLKNVQLSYLIPKELFDKLKCKGNLTIKLGAENLLTFTKYPGIDPEVFSGSDNVSSNLSPGNAGLGSPQVRTLYYSLNFSF